MDGQRTRRFADLEIQRGLLHDRSSRLQGIVEADLTAWELRVEAQKEGVSVDAELKAVEDELRRLQAEAGL